MALRHERMNAGGPLNGGTARVPPSRPNPSSSDRSFEKEEKNDGLSAKTAGVSVCDYDLTIYVYHLLPSGIT